jgi:hypothetical protein
VATTETQSSETSSSKSENATTTGFRFYVTNTEVYDTEFNSNVVKRLFWNIVYKDGEVQAGHSGITVLDDRTDVIPEFVEINALTPELVLNWVEATTNISSIKSSLIDAVEAKKKYCEFVPAFAKQVVELTV